MITRRTQLQLLTLGCILVLGCGFGTAQNAQAQTDIVLSVGIIGDTTAPTAPTELRAAVESNDQVVLSWVEATDNVGVVGYVVLRDGVEIATTTETEFTDTEADTPGTYEYQISAFDAVGLRSLLSDGVVVELGRRSSGGGGRSSSAPSAANDVSVTALPTQGAVMLQWSTARPAVFVVEWGTSREYELGSITTSSFSRAHSVALTDLVPGTRYYYRLRVPESSRAVTASSFVFMPIDAARVVTTDQVFVRQSATGYEVVVAALPEGVVKVRVVRNPFQPARDQQDGDLLYEGGVGVMPLRGIDPTLGFMTAFAYTRSGTVSAGTLLSVPREWHDRMTEAVLRTSAVVRWIQAGAVTLVSGAPAQLFGFTPIDIQVELQENVSYAIMELRHSSGQLQQIVLTPNQSQGSQEYTARIILPQLGSWSVAIYTFDEVDTASLVYTHALQAVANPAPAEERVLGLFLNQLSEYDMRRLLYELLYEILSRFINR